MIRRLRALVRRPSQTRDWPDYDPAQPSAVPAGRIVYAIGDIHGRSDLFCALLDHVACDSVKRPEAAITLIVLGDVIDRGPDSRLMLDTLFRLNLARTNLIVLRGNHEQLLLDVIDGNYDALSLWLRHGGREFLSSFDIDEALIDPDRMRELTDALLRAIPPDIIAWLRSWPVYFHIGDYFFVHAGIRPEVPIDQQSDADMLWIREDFYRHAGPHPAVIVHGHSIAEDGPEVLPYRIGLDTGAYRTDILTGIRLEGTERRILQSSNADSAASATARSLPGGELDKPDSGKIASGS